MTKQTIISTVFLWLAIIGFSRWAVAQNNTNELEKILKLDREILDIDDKIKEAEYNIKLRQENYQTSLAAAEECKQSFLNAAEKDHEEADNWRAIIDEYNTLKAQKESEKAGLIQSRKAQ